MPKALTNSANALGKGMLILLLVGSLVFVVAGAAIAITQPEAAGGVGVSQHRLLRRLRPCLHEHAVAAQRESLKRPGSPARRRKRKGRLGGRPSCTRSVSLRGAQIVS